MHGAIKYGRNTIVTKRQFTGIYERKLHKTMVSIIVFGRLSDRNHPPPRAIMIEDKKKIL